MSPRGGKREGAGRPRSEPTKAVRLPVSQLVELERLKNRADYKLPVFASKIQAGFPSPADDYIEGYLDLNSKFIKHPSSTFVLQATGDSMIDAGIFSGDWLLVDRSLEPADGRIVIAAVNGELTVKRLSKKGGGCNYFLPIPNLNPLRLPRRMKW